MERVLDILALAVLTAAGDGVISPDAVQVVKAAAVIIGSMLTMIGGFVGWAWKRTWDELKELRENQRKSIGVVHGRLDKIPEDYVSRREFEVHMRILTAALEKLDVGLKEISTSVRANHAESDARLDGLANGMAELNISLNELKREARR